MNLYLGFRLYSERCKYLITVINNLHLCPSYQHIKALSNQLGNVVIEAFETHQAPVGSKSSLGKFTTCAFDNIDHNPSSSTAYGSFHGSALSITRHFDETCSDSDKLINPVIRKETPKSLKLLLSFYKFVQNFVDYDKCSTKLPLTYLTTSSFLAEHMSMLVDEESDWLNHVWESYSTDITQNWSLLYASKESLNARHRCQTDLLPLFAESSTDSNMVYHAMRLIKYSTDLLNSGQTPVMTCDQPINAIAKQLQWSELYPDISEQTFFVMLRGLHLEKISLKLIGDILKDSEWPRILAQSGIFTSEVAEKLLSASHLIKTRRLHKITLAALHVLKMKAYEERIDHSVDYDQWAENKLKESPMFFYWSLVMELETNVLGFIRAIRTQNWKMYCKYVKTICPCFFALNHPLYARRTSIHIQDIEVLELSDSGLKTEFAEGKFLITKSSSRFSVMALDQNHKQCNAVVKGKRGVTDLFLKDEALMRWLIAQSIIVDLLKDFHKEIGFSEDKFDWLHHEESCSYKERFKEELNGLVQAFEHVGNPFADSSRKLFTLCSRQVSDAEGIHQLQNLKTDGIQKFESFVTSRILENEDFTKPITKVAIDLFGKTRKKTNKSREMIKCDTSLLQKIFISSYVFVEKML